MTKMIKATVIDETHLEKNKRCQSLIIESRHCGRAGS